MVRLLAVAALSSAPKDAVIDGATEKLSLCHAILE